MFEKCSNYKDPYYKNPFWSAAGKLFKFFDKVGKVGQALNIGMHVHDLFNSRAAIDTCFSITDKKVGKCTSPIVGWYKGTYKVGKDGDYDCGGSLGKTESFYLYISANDKVGGVIRSFHSTIPDLLTSTHNNSLFRNGTDDITIQPGGSVPNGDGGTSAISLYRLLIKDGKLLKYATTNVGKAFYYVDKTIRAGKCAPHLALSTYDVYYEIFESSGAFFHATTPPPELSASEVQAILDRVK